MHERKKERKKERDSCERVVSSIHVSGLASIDILC